MADASSVAVAATYRGNDIAPMLAAPTPANQPKRRRVISNRFDIWFSFSLEKSLSNCVSAQLLLLFLGIARQRCEPNRRTPGSFLNRRRHIIRQCYVCPVSVIRAPAAGWIFQHANV